MMINMMINKNNMMIIKMMISYINMRFGRVMTFCITMRYPMTITFFFANDSTFVCIACNISAGITRDSKQPKFLTQMS